MMAAPVNPMQPYVLTSSRAWSLSQARHRKMQAGREVARLGSGASYDQGYCRGACMHGSRAFRERQRCLSQSSHEFDRRADHVPKGRP